MAAEIQLISESHLCRLCCTKNVYGIDLFAENADSESLYKLVNRYLPIQVENDDLLPKTICPGCHIQLESTKLFMDLIIKGQSDLRKLIQIEQEHLRKEHDEKQKLEKLLKNQENLCANVESYTLQSDENGEKYIIQIFNENALFPPQHELVFDATGGDIEKPKRKRGRPPKSHNQEELAESSKEIKRESKRSTDDENNQENEDPDSRKRRKIRAPVRYTGTVQGDELDKIFKSDETTTNGANEEQNRIKPIGKNLVEIGKVVRTDELNSEKSVYFHKVPRKYTKRKCTSRKRKFVCKICNKSMSHLGQFEFHSKSHKATYGCETKDCQLQSDKKSDIIEHQKETEHVGIVLIDPISNSVLLNLQEKIYDDASTSNKEKKNHVGEKTFECLKCAKSFSCKQNYEVHLKAVHDGVRPFKCDKCPKKFAYACSLKTHQVSHKNESNKFGKHCFLCDICAKKFNHPSSLLYHKETEHGNQRFICNKCNKTFKHRQLLQRHQMVHSDERPFKCHLCSQAFKTNSNLVMHGIVHTGVKKFHCTKCNQSFGHKTSFSIHMRWHEGTKPYQCDCCHKTFSQKGNLLEHRRIHTGEKPFSCEFCPKRFTTSSQQKLHRKKHCDEGNKQYHCGICDKHFQHKESYVIHLRRHLNTVSFKCKYCGKGFSENWTCLRHEKIHLRQKIYNCDCGKTLIDGASVIRHKKMFCPLRKTIVENNFDGETNENDQNLQENIPIKVKAAGSNTTEEIVGNPIIDINSSNIQELFDNEGNAINFTASNGEPIVIASADNTEQFQGVMQDGTIVSFDILPQQNEICDNQATSKQSLNLGLDGEIEFSDQSNPEMLTNVKNPFLTEDGKVCFITSIDGNSFLIN